VANTATIGARALWQSLQRLGSLPEHLQIWPGHGAGSSCGKALGALPTSTLGYERRTNWALGVHDENTFVRSVLADQPDPPPYFGTMKRVNRDGPEIVGDLAALPELTADRLALELPRSVVIDLRPAKAYAETHIPGTLNLAFNKAFTKWAGWLVSNDQDVFLIAENPAMAEEARRALLAIGLDRVRGMTTTAAAAALMRGGTALASRRMSMKHVAELAAAGRHIIDVRDDHEWADGHVPGAEHHSLGRVQESLRNLDRATPVAVHCQGGGRSAIAASVLERMGFKDIVDLSDGWSAFEGNR
jgi:hydroxyacylglutathione hydrolase